MNKKLAELTNGELVRKEKTLRSLLFSFAAVWVLLVIITIISAINKHFSSTMIMPAVLLPLLVVDLNNWQKLKAEIKAKSL